MKNETTEIAQAIAAALGSEWSATSSESDWYSCLERSDGLGLFLQPRDKRLYISHDNVHALDENGTNQTYGTYDTPSITVSSTRTASAIAKDITARLLPYCEARQVEAVKWQKQMAERAAAIEALRSRLLAYPGVTLSQMNGSHVYGSGWTAELYPGSTSITFRSVSDEHLFALIEAIQPQGEPMKTTTTQPDMFPTGEDLPIFSGAPVTARAKAFHPQPSQAQPGLLDLRPTFGGGEPSYTARDSVIPPTYQRMTLEAVEGIGTDIGKVMRAMQVAA